MNILAVIVITFQFIYIIYSDIQNRKERESLQLKLMSKDLNDYKNFKEDVVTSGNYEEDPYIDIDEAGLDKIVKSKDMK
jgi:predicted transport protein